MLGSFFHNGSDGRRRSCTDQSPLTSSLFWRLVKAAVLVGHTSITSQTGWHTEPFNVKRLLLFLPLLVAGTPVFAFWGSQEPWATPKGDARTDCAVYKAKEDRYYKLSRQLDRAQKRALDKLAEITALQSREEASSWFNSDTNPLHKISRKQREALVEKQLAQMSVVKHLGYSKQRLRQMWDWRLVNGEKFKQSIGEKDHLQRFWENEWDWREIDKFCESF